AEGPLKATIEVTRVEDERTSLCKVNTYYDIDGREIAVSEATPARILREGASALKEGDLLFNLLWGTRVAVVGVVDFTGLGAGNAASEMDNFTDFLRHLQRMGVVVDAYNDLRDGKMVGEVTDHTNIIIRGSPATKLAGGDDEGRLKAINGNIQAMRQEAIDRGLFMISADNFAVVTGYRRAGRPHAQPTLTFRPPPP